MLGMRGVMVDFSGCPSLIIPNTENPQDASLSRDARERERSVRPSRGKSGRSTGDISTEYGHSLTTTYFRTYIHTPYLQQPLQSTPDYINTNHVRWRSLGSPILPSRGVVQEPRERVPAANEERCVLDGRLHLQAHCLVR